MIVLSLLAETALLTDQYLPAAGCVRETRLLPRFCQVSAYLLNTYQPMLLFVWWNVSFKSRDLCVAFMDGSRRVLYPFVAV